MSRRRRPTALVAAALATLGALASLAGCGSAATGGPVTITFQSLAFQPATIAATKRIVQDWNAAHPRVHVVLQQGSWDTVHDKLVTQFAGGTAPDVIQDDAADLAGFGQQGYLADLSARLPASVRAAVPAGLWDTVRAGSAIIAAPTLLQSYVVFANTALLRRDGVTIPSGSLGWSTLRAMAAQATGDGRFGLAWGLQQPTATMMTLALNFGGTYFSGSGRTAAVHVGAAENAVPQRIHDMAYVDHSLDPVSLTRSGTDVLPGFYAGRYAMIVGGNFVAQQIREQAPASFRWAVLPPLAGTSARQAADPQVLAVPQASSHIDDAAGFVAYYMQARNLAALARGDWLIPTTPAAQTIVGQSTGGRDGWSQTLAGARNQVAAPFQSELNYPRWKDQIAEPAFQRYLDGQTSLSQLDDALISGWGDVNR